MSLTLFFRQLTLGHSEIPRYQCIYYLYTATENAVSEELMSNRSKWARPETYFSLVRR